MLIKANDAGDWAAARRLVEEYARSLDVDLCFQNFDRELASFESEYGPPHGAFFLARELDAFIGGGGLRRRDARSCEMKRLYVRPGSRGAGVGRAIAEALIAEARRIGYEAMVLDTLPTMTRAQGLYRTLGFTATTAYRFNPVQGTIYLELEL